MLPRPTSPGLQRGARVASLHCPILRLARTHSNPTSPGTKAENPGGYPVTSNQPRLTHAPRPRTLKTSWN
jgi:hypothetical protein